MQPDHDEVAHGLRMTAIAVVSAILTATLVIAVGQAWISQSAPRPLDPQPVELIRTSG